MGRGVLVVLSGFSGSGKGTMTKMLMAAHDNYSLSISATTRSPREGEQEGVHYFYKTKEEFEQLIKDDALYEYACYVDNYYGTPKAYVEGCLEKGKDVILEIEMQGALKVKEKCPDAVLLFITPPTADELERRLRGRGTETEEVIRARLRRAKEEGQYMDQYDYIVINDNKEECASTIHNLIQMQHLRVCDNAAFIKQIKDELNNMED